jgi:hypothetical protein
MKGPFEEHPLGYHWPNTRADSYIDERIERGYYRDDPNGADAGSGGTIPG